MKIIFFTTTFIFEPEIRFSYESLKIKNIKTTKNVLAVKQLVKLFIFSQRLLWLSWLHTCFKFSLKSKDRSSRSEMFFRIFGNIHRKTSVLESLFNYQETPMQVFSCEHCKIFKNSFLQNTSDGFYIKPFQPSRELQRYDSILDQSQVGRKIENCLIYHDHS